MKISSLLGKAAALATLGGAICVSLPAVAAPEMMTYSITCQNGTEVTVTSPFAPDPFTACNTNGYNGGAIVAKKPRIHTEKPVVTDIRANGVVQPRGAGLSSAGQLSALVATPRFVEMRRAKNYMGMRDALAGIGVKFTSPALLPEVKCVAPNTWLWGYSWVPSGDGVSQQLVYGPTCANDKL
jgi:hypothetical protein